LLPWFFRFGRAGLCRNQDVSDVIVTADVRIAAVAYPVAIRAVSLKPASNAVPMLLFAKRTGLCKHQVYAVLVKPDWHTRGFIVHDLLLLSLVMSPPESRAARASL